MSAARQVFTLRQEGGRLFIGGGTLPAPKVSTTVAKAAARSTRARTAAPFVAPPPPPPPAPLPLPVPGPVPMTVAPAAKRARSTRPPWLTERTWLGADGVKAKENRELARRAGLGRQVVDVVDLMRRPGWEGSTVSVEVEHRANIPWGPLGYAAANDLAAMRGEKLPIAGPSNGFSREVSVVTHPSGAVARIWVRP